MQRERRIISVLLIFFMLFSTVSIANSVEVNNGYYIVKQGDTMDSVATQFGVTVKQLIEWNQLPNPPIIFSGKLLKIAEKQNANKPKPTSTSGQSEFVSINLVDAEVRDILGVVAFQLDQDILYVGDSFRFTIRASKVAKEDLLDVVVSTAGGLAWVKSGNLIIVAKKETINSDFTNNLVFTGVNLKYITATELDAQAKKFMPDILTTILGQNSKKIWVQGLPVQISRFYQLVKALDQKSNFPSASNGSKISNATNDTFLNKYNLEYIDGKTLESMVNGLNIFPGLKVPLTFYYNDINPTVCYVGGPMSISEDFGKLVSQLDVKGSTMDPSTGDLVGMSKYVLKNISYSDAENTLTYSKLAIAVMDLKSYPKTVFFFGPKLLRDEAFRLLQSIDIKGQLVTEIIDYASDTSKLANRRDLICDISGLSVTNFAISSDIDRASSPKYVLYYTGTEAEIARIRYIVLGIDSPTGGG